MSITTRVGDGGRTRLYSGEIVSKSDPRLETLGALDELVSALGVVRAHLADAALREAVLEVQRALFTVGAEAATTPDTAAALPARIGAAEAARMDAWSRELEARADAPRGFIVPGESAAGAFTDVARTLARRCERRIVALADAGRIANPHLLQWINRLSDALWLLARVVEGHSRPLRPPPS